MIKIMNGSDAEKVNAVHPELNDKQEIDNAIKEPVVILNLSEILNHCEHDDEKVQKKKSKSPRQKKMSQYEVEDVTTDESSNKTDQVDKV